MLVLGWHGNPRAIETDTVESFAYHDAAAALVRDGQVIAAIEEERLNRVKHSNVFPTRAVRACLSDSGYDFTHLDAIVTDLGEEFLDFIALRDASFNPRFPMQTGRQLVASAFEREFGVDVTDKIHFCRHHLAHLASAYLPSGFARSLVITIDGYGDGSSGLIAQCSGEHMEILRQIPESQSLGNFYLHNLFFLGYHRFDEYKAMGLAPYGDPMVYDATIKKMYELLPEGRYRLLPLQQCFLLMKDSGTAARARRKGEPFSQEHKDFAAALQMNLEQIVEHIVAYFQKQTRATHLCLSGGVAHNCSMNGKLLRSGLFERIYVQPAAHDAGNAIGAALSVTRELKVSLPPKPLPNLFLGLHVGEPNEIRNRLSAWQPLIQIERLQNVEQQTAALLADRAVIGWVQGRSEFGPRALGNRSILADPRPAENQTLINSMVKKREAFRPFAPAVIEERLHEYFEVPPQVRALPFMVMVAPVKPTARKLLGAVTHVDGTARVQSVSSLDNPRFHGLIEAFGELTGTPVLLNTSFNNHAEPIVDSLDDALTCFLTTGLNALVIDEWLIRRNPDAPLTSGLRALVASISTSHKLVSGRDRQGRIWRGIEPHSLNPFAPQLTTALSPRLFELLASEEPMTVGTYLQRAQMQQSECLKLSEELIELWGARCVRLLPVAPVSS